MSHRATIYNVRVRKRGKPNEFVPLGDIDEKGTYLADALKAIVDDGFVSDSAKDDKEVRCESSNLDGEDLQLTFLHGERGLVADIMDPDGQLRIRQNLEDTTIVRCGSVFRLPRSQNLGFWAVHINSNRSAKGLVHVEMVKRFREQFPDLRLVVMPCVLGSVLQEALDNDQLESVKLFKYEASSDFADARRWVRGDVHAKVELRISARERGKRLAGELARRALAGDTEAQGQIIEFQGLEFDEAKVQVALDDGYRRTFRIQGPASGHPFAAEIEPEIEGGEPTDASVFTELGKVLTEME